jgi:O-antigen/teichoic acid export membrane protein
MSVAEPAPPGNLRRLAARGSLINAAFLVGVASLGAIEGFVVAGFLTRHDYGVWGLLIASLSSLGLLKQVGVPDRYVQQRHADQEQAFQEAFTLELLLDAALALLLLIAVPVLAFAYGREELLGPGFALVLAVPAVALQFPLWIFYRRMEYGRQRVLGAITPLVQLVVSIVLAAAGAGYWSLVIGAIAGNYAAAIWIVAVSPYRLKLRFRRSAMREYASFSWPLFVASLGGLVVSQGAVIVGTPAVGLAGVGGIALASSIVSYTTQVDQIVSGALYPVICAVRDRRDLLLESFVKANRLGLLWGAPLGVAIALFTPAAVRYGLGQQWRPAIDIIRAFGLIAAVDQIAYNWDDYFRALGRTRPMAIVNVLSTGVYLAVAMPLLATHGLGGFAIGMAISAVVGVLGRLFFLTRLFPAFDVVTHVLRAIAPTAPAAVVVLAIRALGAGGGLGMALGELAAYVAIVLAATVALERPLLRELVGYLSPAV